MNDLTRQSLLMRPGYVLIAIGLLDIGVMVYCILHGISYASSFNIFALLGGIFLIRGSVRAAAIVTFFAAFLSSGAIAMIAVITAVPHLSAAAVASIHTDPFTFIFHIVLTSTAIWTSFELTKDPIRKMVFSGRSRRSVLQLPVLIGLVVVAIAFYFNKNGMQAAL